MSRLFGTDGVRGVANEPPMTPQFMMKLAFAAGCVMGRKVSGTFVIGRDTRLSGDMIEAAVVAGFTAAGMPVVRTGVLPTPAISYLARKLGALGGVVISASHNPFEDNGVKFFAGTGDKLPDPVEDEIEKFLVGMDDAGMHHHQTRHRGASMGKVEQLESGLDDYVAHAVASFGIPGGLKGLKVVVDCAHGAAYRSSPRVLEQLGAEVIAINASPDGTNINRDCGSLHPEKVRAAVEAHGAHVGITHDGDADRVLLVDEKGQLLDGDQILAVLARDFKERGELPNQAIVATVMSNIGLGIALKPHDIRVFQAPVGDRYVREQMDKEKLVLGGEQSGHIILSRLGPTGDGLLTALSVLQVLVRRERPLSELHAFITRFPQTLVNVKVRERLDLKSIPGLWDKVREIEQELGEEGRVFLRYSGTEPKARIMVEGPDQQRVEGYASEIARILRDRIGAE